MPIYISRPLSQYYINNWARSRFFQNSFLSAGDKLKKTRSSRRTVVILSTMMTIGPRLKMTTFMQATLPSFNLTWTTMTTTILTSPWPRRCVKELEPVGVAITTPSPRTYLTSPSDIPRWIGQAWACDNHRRYLSDVAALSIPPRESQICSAPLRDPDSKRQWLYEQIIILWYQNDALSVSRPFLLLFLITLRPSRPLKKIVHEHYKRLINLFLERLRESLGNCSGL